MRAVLAILAAVSVVSAKGGKAASLNLADATLVVMDGLADEGMKLARELLAKDSTDVNLAVEMDDGSKGTPLVAAIHTTTMPKGENCMDLVRLLLAHKNTDVNAALTAPDDTTIPPLVLAMKAVTAGLPVGTEIAKALLAHENINVNAMTAGGSTKLAPLHMALAAAARGAEGGLELAGALLTRSDTNADIEMMGPDGTKMTPLAKLASMLHEQPDDTNLLKAIGLLKGRAKPLEDEEKQRLVDSVASKDEL